MEVLLEVHDGEFRSTRTEKGFEVLKGSHKVKNEIKSSVKLSYFKESRRKDKKDFSTIEKVIDPKTEQLLERWMRNGPVSEINGCISAGKEANVYYAPGKEEAGQDYAIKIYKVETMVFRDREDYIEGEFRFRKGKFFVEI
jgi:RIO kinase 1